MAAEWTVAAGTLALAVATIGLAAVAIFQDKIRGWLVRPKLEVSLVNTPPDCHKITVAGYLARAGRGVPPISAASYYFRFRVTNTGNQRAEFVEAFAAELLVRQPEGKFKRVDSFLPMNLLWAHVDRPFLPAISPRMPKLCNLGHIIEPALRDQLEAEDNQALGVAPDKAIFSFDLEVKPNTLSHLIAPGVYRLRLMVAAANARPVEKTIEIDFTGDWHDEESKMLSEGIRLTLL